MFQRLAMPANMGAALSYHNALDGSAASWARGTGTPKNVERIPISAASGPEAEKIILSTAEGGSVIFQSVAQYLAHGPMERTDFLVGKTARLSQGVNTGRP